MEEQSDWGYGGADEGSIETVTMVPVRAFADRSEAADYISAHNSLLMSIAELPFGPENG